jgi:uncharacterized protein
MDWTVYWFMLPVCIAIAGMAMFSAISGAAMLIPVFLIGFPLVDVPGLTTVEAVGTALLLETSGFGMGLYRYLSLRLVDLGTAWRLVAVTLPLGMLGAIASAQAPVDLLRSGYGVAMVALAFLLVREPHPAEPVRSVPGGVLGAFLGIGLQGRVSPTTTRWFFSTLFLLIGTVFPLALTVFAERFA